MMIDDTLLRWFADHDLCEDLGWTTHSSALLTYEGEPSGEIKFFVLCNDMFWWGTADSEWVTNEDIPELQRAYDDLENSECHEVWAPQLWISRKRGMRPQRPWWDRERIPDPVKELFKAAGPHRDPKEEG